LRNARAGFATTGDGGEARARRFDVFEEQPPILLRRSMFFQALEKQPFPIHQTNRE
jgi:hypothetical protein